VDLIIHPSNETDHDVGAMLKKVKGPGTGQRRCQARPKGCRAKRRFPKMTYLRWRSNCAASSSVIQLGRTPWPRVEM
jgi:hypothetical protein